MNWLKHKYLAYKGTHPYARKVFVLGTGRSGTHWLANTLATHPEISVTFEKSPIFNKVTAMALNFSLKERYFPSVVRSYRLQHARVAPRHYVDKSHPNLWLAGDLARVFPRALFIGIQRNPYATVASMLRHAGVRRWCEIWQRFPVPNPFLGIDASNAADYGEYTLTERCAMRWLSHARRMEAVKTELGERLQVLQYEDLFDGSGEQLRRVQDFLNLNSPIQQPPPKRESLDKWRRHLDAEQRAAIQRLVGTEPPSKTQNDLAQ